MNGKAALATGRLFFWTLAWPALAMSIVTSARAAERTFTTSSFDKVRIEGPYGVEVITGKGSSARASGSAQALDRLSVSVQGETLIIKPDRSGWGGWPGQPGDAAGATIAVTTPQLAGLQINGSGGVKVNRMAGPRLNLVVSGSGDVSVARLESDYLTLTLQGAGKIVLAGKAANARIALLGAGDINASALFVADADITAAGSGAIRLASSRSVRVNASGSGNVVITGKTACMVNNRGSGQVSCGDGQKAGQR